MWEYLYTESDKDLYIGYGRKEHLTWMKAGVPPTATNEDWYYTPALHSAPNNSKASVAGSRVAWADVDAPTYSATFPPTFAVWSGHGWHLYWALKELVDDDLLETINRLLARDVGGDSCWNANRLLRVPGTINYSSQEPVRCELRWMGGHVYQSIELLALGVIPNKIIHKIRTGDTRGEPSRSERDFKVVSALVSRSVRPETIAYIFSNNPVGDRARERSHTDYLDRTIRKAASQDRGTAPVGIFADNGAYYVGSSGRVRLVSTFILEPRALLKCPDGDALLCDVVSGTDVCKDVVFRKSDFASRAALDRVTPRAGQQWLGSDDHVRLLLPHLLSLLYERGLPSVSGSPVLGLHRGDTNWLFLGERRAASGTDTFREPNASPMVYIPTGREHPPFWADSGSSVGAELTEELRKSIGTLLCNLNKPSVVYPIVGWYHAATCKPALEELGYKFPILNLFGTKGSGKTTTIATFQELMGYKVPTLYDAATTRFVMLSLLGSTNAIPIAFSEHRGTMSSILRYILLSYDAGKDARGTGTQQTIEYPLTAPFSVDGEDQVADPAAKERIIAVQFHRDTVDEPSARTALRELTALPLSLWSQAYIQFVLSRLDNNELPGLIAKAEQAVHTLGATPPVRVVRNLQVVWVGIELFCAFSGLGAPDPKVLQDSLRLVYSELMGRSPTYADEFVADVANHVARISLPAFPWRAVGKELWFQFSPAYVWWRRNRRASGDIALQRDAIAQQLTEAPYFLGRKTIGRVWMYGVDLEKAFEGGLDVPSAVKGVAP